MADLKRLVARVGVHNPTAAEKLGTRILDAVESLAFFPERHPRVRQRPHLRRCVVARHFKVFYQIQPERGRVLVLRCWDGRRGADPS